MLSSNGFLPLITRPTRVTATSATLIDNIFTNNLIDISSSLQGLLVTDITDHYPVFHIDRQTCVKEAEVFVYKRLFSSKHKNDFYHALSVTDWNEIYRASDTQCAYDLFHDHLLELYNKHFPKIRTKKKYNNRKPWLSEALKNSIRHKNKLYLKYTKVRSAFNEDCYKKYKSKLQHLLKVAEKQYFHDLITRYRNNAKKSWEVIKTIINGYKKTTSQTKFKLDENHTTTDKKVIADKFNDFFINVGPTMSKLIPNVKKAPISYMTNRMNESLFLDPVSESEIKERLISLKETATGHDEINTMSLKLSNNLIAQPLAHICNLSLTEGIFPHQLKIANVIPIYKSDDPMLFNHYRPVSMLCILSKVFEKIMYDRLLNFLERYKILYDKQYGFRKKHSTYMALITLMDKLTNAIENGEYVIGIFLDFSKAFDTVNHDILLEKLEHYGIRCCALSWFRSYLSNRPQYVTYNGTTSMSQTIKCGVPQGSILGPLLFLIYINDLWAMSVQILCPCYLLMTPIFLLVERTLYSYRTL